MKVKEIQESRKTIGTSIEKMENGIARYRAYRLEQDEIQTRLAEERRQELLAKQAEEKSKSKRGGLRSALSKKTTPVN